MWTCNLAIATPDAMVKVTSGPFESFSIEQAAASQSWTGLSRPHMRWASSIIMRATVSVIRLAVIFWCTNLRHSVLCSVSCSEMPRPTMWSFHDQQPMTCISLCHVHVVHPTLPSPFSFQSISFFVDRWPLPPFLHRQWSMWSLDRQLRRPAHLVSFASSIIRPECCDRLMRESCFLHLRFAEDGSDKLNK